jgi:hypothetical protein
MTPTQTNTIGLGEIVIEQLDKETTALTKGGMDVPVARATLELAVEEARAANALQESLKHQLTTATKLTVAKMERAYTIASGTIDMMMAAVEKTSDVAKVFQRLRSKMSRPNRDETAEPLPVPVPEATR